MKTVNDISISQHTAGQPAWSGGAGSGVLGVAASGRVLAASGSVEALLGCNTGLAGFFLQPFFDEADRGRIDEALKAGGVAPGPVLARTIDGAARQVELFFEPADEGVTILVIDRTASEAALDDLRRDAENASAASRSSAALLADLGHEMRTPLNAVIGFAEAMQSETFGPIGHQKYEEYADHIGKSGTHLLDLINSILDLAKYDAGRLVLHREMTNVDVLVRDCVAMMEPAAREAGLSLSFSTTNTLPESWIDPQAVRRILINLLSNAIKFTSDGGVTVSLAQEGDSLRLMVSDTGIGMNETELNSLGARFAAASSDGVRGAKGAGLGLALCFALAKAHDGSLDLESAPGEGVTARVQLPIARAPNPKIRKDDRTEEAGVHSQLDRIAALKRELAAKKSAA